MRLRIRDVETLQVVLMDCPTTPFCAFPLCSPLPLSLDRALPLSSVQFSYSVVSDSLRPHELKHARPPCVGMLEIQNLVPM